MTKPDWGKCDKLSQGYRWAGLRPTSPNSVPYICRIPNVKNLSLNAGHYRNGIVTAPASAQVMVDILLDRPSNIDLSPYKLTR